MTIAHKKALAPEVEDSDLGPCALLDEARASDGEDIGQALKLPCAIIIYGESVNATDQTKL